MIPKRFPEVVKRWNRGFFVALLGALLALAIQACVREPRPTDEEIMKPSARIPSSSRQTVVASYYGEGDGFEGKPTASGEKFERDKLTAAHRSLPFGTLLKLTEPVSGKTVQVRVNDRGPFVRGRSLDISAAAAKALGFKQKGVKKLEMEVLPGSQELSRSDDQ